MSPRKFRREKLKREKGNSKIKFTDMWRYEQISFYGEEEYMNIIKKNKMFKTLKERASQ